MENKKIKAFTLVEMLIVIVIIGILIAALMPRMQAAQGRARDVSRKTALSQIQSAIVVSQGDKGVWPGQDENNDECTPNCAQAGMGISSISGSLTRAGMNSVPVDPLKSTELKGLGNFSGNDLGDYAYMIAQRNGTKNGGFILMAKTEVEGSSNWVVCEGKDSSDNALTYGRIKSNNAVDIVNIHPCTKFVKNETSEAQCKIENETCTYDNDGELRYIVLY